MAVDVTEGEGAVHSIFFSVIHGSESKETVKRTVKGIQFVKQKISEHKDSFKPNESPRDYIDAFLLAQRNDGSEEDSVFNGKTISKYNSNIESVK